MPTIEQNKWIASVLGVQVPGLREGDQDGEEGGFLSDLASFFGLKSATPVLPPQATPAQATPAQAAPAQAAPAQAIPVQAAPAQAAPAQAIPLGIVPPQSATSAVTPPKVETPEERAERIERKLRRKQAFGRHQETLSNEIYATLPPSEQDDFDVLLGAAATTAERNFLRKALASKHSLGEIAAFAEEIRGQEEDWLLDNLMLTGDSQGHGIQQQFVMSCQASTVQAARGALDPIFALSLRKATGDIAEVRADTSGQMAAQQKQLLETPKPPTVSGGKSAAGGVARPLADYKAAPSEEKAAKKGRGRRGLDLLNADADTLGVEYETVLITNQGQRDAAVDDIAARLGQGLPVPLSVGGGDNQLAHYVLALATAKGRPRIFYIHDPGRGRTVMRTEAQLKGSTMNLPSGWNFLNKYEKPKAK